METRIIGLSLSETLKKDLGRLFYGLPETIWLEPRELHVRLIELEIPNPSYDLDIVELLKSLTLSSLPLTIISPNLALSKGGIGHIQLRIKEKDFLNRLRATIEKPLKRLPVSIASSEEGLIVLGKIEKLIPSKLSNWMEMHSFFSEIAFFPLELIYLKPQTSAKNKFFIPLEKIPFPGS